MTWMGWLGWICCGVAVVGLVLVVGALAKILEGLGRR